MQHRPAGEVFRTLSADCHAGVRESGSGKISFGKLSQAWITGRERCKSKAILTPAFGASRDCL